MISVNIILKTPVLTEKALVKQDLLNQYTFWVAPGVNKNQVSQAFTETFGVKPLRVNIAKVHGKIKNDWKKRHKIQKPDRTKAIITLSPKDKIDVLAVKTGKK